MLKCKEDNCTKRPSYNIENEKNALYCVKHKKDNMIDIKSKRCVENGCYKQPTYNFENEKKALYCVKHKKDNMIDVKNIKCIENGCYKQSTYNFENEKKALYCYNHKKDNMIDIKHHKCIEYKCNIRPNFNFENEKKGLYCSIHKKDGMIHIKKKICNFSMCSINPVFNYNGEKRALYCFKHKKDNMIDILHILCIIPECNIRPSYNYKGITKALYCNIHKSKDMIDVVHKSCVTNMCNTIISNNKYNGYCLRCFVYLFPDMPNSRNYKTKEVSVVEYIKKEFQYTTIITDKKIEEGCSRRRPDILLDLGYQVIIIEIDENQHINYDCSCENKRLMELSQDVGHRPIIFIRFNPDNYLDKDNNNITSCWAIDGHGISSIKKSKVNEWNDRLDLLKHHIQYWIDSQSSKTVEIIQLFYNQNI